MNNEEGVKVLIKKVLRAYESFFESFQKLSKLFWVIENLISFRIYLKIQGAFCTFKQGFESNAFFLGISLFYCRRYNGILGITRSHSDPCIKAFEVLKIESYLQIARLWIFLKTLKNLESCYFSGVLTLEIYEILKSNFKIYFEGFCTKSRWMQNLQTFWNPIVKSIESWIENFIVDVLKPNHSKFKLQQFAFVLKLSISYHVLQFFHSDFPRVLNIFYFFQEFWHDHQNTSKWLLIFKIHWALGCSHTNGTNWARE